MGIPSYVSNRVEYVCSVEVSRLWQMYRRYCDLGKGKSCGGYLSRKELLKQRVILVETSGLLELPTAVLRSASIYIK